MRQRRIRGSLTVEAALLLPAAMSVILFFLYLFQILWAEQQLSYAGLEALQTVSDCGYLLKYAGAELERAENGSEEYEAVTEIAEEVLREAGSGVWFQNSLRRNLPAGGLVEKIVESGLRGISFRGSDVYAEDEMAVLCIACQIRFPVFRGLLPAVTLEKRFLLRSFSGDGELELSEEETQEESEEGRVYVTETGTVYHKSRNCTYIKLSLEQKPFDSIGQSRNASGGKYYPCTSCIKEESNLTVVWVTRTGTHYHAGKECSKIKRSVREITMSEAEKYRPCSRCAASG
ncbi:MAG: pilus assembly protein [Lachnospiraceae bacterium]|nr:pilus assembly protein [Lachnospiraceae bacterium]